ncbi:MAG: patatin-like phospholipase family protein [Anaerolineae bacterium]|nr:patatin-like phospholipase family protein [Anaerolineae bacterium]
MTPLYILRGIPLFKNLEDNDLKLIAGRLKSESYPKGALVFKEGDVGDTMYLVESGQVTVMHGDTGEAIAHLGPGAFVGEISLLLAQPRTASLRVDIDAELWALRKVDFEKLLNTRPSIGLEMMRELSQRLVTTTRRQKRRLTRRITALLIPPHSPGSPEIEWGGFELAQALYSQLKSTVGVLPLPNARLENIVTLSGGVMILDNDNLDEGYLAKSLSYQVEVYKHIIIILPDTPDPLAEKAMELADTVVVVGRPPDWFLPHRQKQDVWIAGGAEVDLWRTARRLTNRTVGLALSSGGSRGLAHIGVMKVLLQEEIPIDLVAGTSAGAWFGAFFAAGWSPARLDQFVTEIKDVTKFSNWDFNIPPRTGIAKGRKARDRVIDRSVEGRTFEDLKIPLCIVAADILTGDEVVFDSGPLADAIRASLSVPVLADPWHYQGRYFVDGGIVNPLPASVLRNRGADIVIASSVVQSLRESYAGSYDQMPNILQIVFNIYSAMEAHVVEDQLPLIDVLIQHKVSAKHTLDFEHVQDLVQLGENTARQMLPAIKQTIAHPPEG